MSTLTILVRHRMRRDRIQVPIWLASLTALLLFSALALQGTFGGLEERTLLAQLAVANPAVRFIRGVPQGTDAAAVLIFTVLAFLGVLVALMNTFLAVRHLRAEEESGRADLVAATPAGVGHYEILDVPVDQAWSLVEAVTPGAGDKWAR